VTDPDGDWQPPPSFEEYRVVRRLGRGAMGEVYLCDDVLLDRQVAVKFVREPPGTQAAASQRFYVEARAIARLQHPHVVAVYRTGRVRRRPYLVSEYVSGRSLDQIELPLPAERIVEIGIALASGLAAAHRRGVLHRDLKPANVMVSDTGEVKLLDFGLAKLLDDPPLPPPTGQTEPGIDVTASPTARTAAPGITRTGALLGTPLYMAPEIWRGEPATAASDVYALGVLLHELAAGRSPRHELPLDELRRAVEDTDPPPLASVAPAIPAGLAAVIDRCVCRDPAARFATAEQVRAALERQREPTGDPASPIAEREPYRGLRPFGAEHRAVFYGRRDHARAVIDRLRADPFVLVAGDSGVGKSSLCAAGVLPEVADGAGSMDGARARAWSRIELVPGRRPRAALALALAPVLGVDEAELARAPADDAPEVGRAVRQHLGAERGLILYVDQLEELVSVSDPAEAAWTAEMLGELALRAPSLRVLATARSDFLTRLAALPRLGPEIGPALYLLAPLTEDGVHDAIVGPARAAGFAFESEAMIAELASSAQGGAGLPLLQFALATLWEARDPVRRVLPAGALAAIGGVGGALAHHADRVVDQLVPRERDAARRILLRLVTTDGARVRREAGELDRSPDGEVALEALVRGRLVVARGEPGGAGTFEIAHEVLLSAWGELRSWMTGDVERRAMSERMERAAREWDRLGRPGDALWSRRQLDELAATEPLELGPTETAFAAASRWAVRRRLLLRRGAVIAVVAAGVLGYAGVRLQARRALAAQVEAQLDEAARALARDPGGELAIARRDALAAFDRTATDDDDRAAEEAWAAYTRRAAEQSALHDRAERALETALLLDPASGEVRRRFGELLYTRALLAERDHRAGERDRHARRLELVDPDGEPRRRWNAPQPIAIASRPPAAVVEIARYGDDARRSLGPHTRLGTTPLRGALVPGSYLLTIARPDQPVARYPLNIEHGAHVDVDIAVPARVPEGYVYVPAGRFLYGSADDERLRIGFFNTQPMHELVTASYFIARHEVTFGDWIEFLDALPAGERSKRIPQSPEDAGMVRLTQVGGTWRLEIQPMGADTLLSATSGELLRYPGRTRREAVDWRHLPVNGISWEDVLVYAAWLDKTGRLPGARPCTEREWERAARGADDRRYTHGDALEPDDADFDRTYGRETNAYGPDEVGSHPVSDSPFGVADMIGNVAEWCLSIHGLHRTLGKPARELLGGDDMVLRGAPYYRDAISNLIVTRNFGTATHRGNEIGARICADAPEEDR
jgi:formylglycine-generating enzyme required for sulfatase activity